MTRQELVQAIAKDTGQTQATVNAVLNSFVANVQDGVAAGDKIALVGFGTFEAVERAARSGRNPQTGAMMEIPATRSPKFTAGKAFKDIVRGK